MLLKILRAIARYFRDQKLVNAGMCPLHERKFERGEVEIRYGLLRHPEAYLKARKNRFPYANSYAMGGCYVSDTFPKTSVVDYCPQCRESEASYAL